MKIVRVRNKFIDRMYEKYPEIKSNGDNQRPLQQIDNARWKHNDIIRKLNDQEEFEIYKEKKMQKYKYKNKRLRRRRKKKQLTYYHI